MRDYQPIPPPIDGFRAVGYLGSGGFGDVFLYEDVSTSARVAIKVLREGSLAAGGTQLMQQAQALGRLSANAPHPNIVAVQRVGFTDNDRPYLVMEYCQGGSWAQQIGQKGRIHPSEVLSVGIQIAGALHMAHRQGIVHRDIKPGNILIGARIGGQGIPKLVDFGIAVLTADEVARGSAWISRDYCAPEVLESGEADELADIFALAATLYHALAGHSWVRDPEGDNSPDAIEQRIRSSPVPPIGSFAPETLEFLLRAAMTRDRHVRAMTFPTAKDFAMRLQDIELELQYRQTRLPVEDADDHTGPQRGLPPAPAGWHTGISDVSAARAETGSGAQFPNRMSHLVEQPRQLALWVTGVVLAALGVGAALSVQLRTGSWSQVLLGLSTPTFAVPVIAIILAVLLGAAMLVAVLVRAHLVFSRRNKTAATERGHILRDSSGRLVDRAADLPYSGLTREIHDFHDAIRIWLSLPDDERSIDHLGLLEKRARRVASRLQRARLSVAIGLPLTRDVAQMVALRTFQSQLDDQLERIGRGLRDAIIDERQG